MFSEVTAMTGTRKIIPALNRRTAWRTIKRDIINFVPRLSAVIGIVAFVAGLFGANHGHTGPPGHGNTGPLAYSGPLGATLTLDEQAQDDESLFFDPAPVDQDVLEGEEAQFRCDVSNRQHIHFHWTLNERPLANTWRRFQDGSNLRVLRADRVLDSGAFRCVAVNVSSGMALRSTEARLNVLWLNDDVIMKAEQKSDSDVSHVTIKCLVNASSEPTVEFFRNKYRIYGTDRIKIKGNRMRVSDVTASDNGLYSCTARLSTKTVYSVDDFILNVAGSPEVTRLDSVSFTRRQIIQAGGRAVFHCLYRSGGGEGIGGGGGGAGGGGGGGGEGKTAAASTEWYKDQRRIASTADMSTDARGRLSTDVTADLSTDVRSDKNSASHSTSKFTLLENGTLSIDDVTDDDAGIYRCIGVSVGGPVQSFASELILAYLEEPDEGFIEPRPTSDLAQLVVEVKGQLDLFCRTLRGIPIPTIRWTGPGGDLIEEEDGRRRRVRVSRDGLQLSLNQAEVSDTGNYSCHVTNMAASWSRTIHVVVSVGPLITRGPLSVRVAEDDTAEFECKFIGTPYPATLIGWIKDDVIVQRMSKRFEVDQSLGLLRITDVMSTDEGNYACVVNTSGHRPVVSTNARLYVEPRLKFRPHPTSMRLELGSDSLVPCRAEGRTSPHITWARDTPSREEGGVNGRGGGVVRFEVANGSLVFREVRMIDAGEYTCTASNDQGHITATIRIDVIVKPRFTLLPVNLTSFEGSSVMLNCSAQGDPLPRIQWDRNNRVDDFEDQRFTVHPNGSLFIAELYAEDEGLYGCTAGNNGGLVRAELYLHVTTAEMYERRMRDVESISRLSGEIAFKKEEEENVEMLKTIVIAACCAVTYLSLVIGLTVCCSLRLMNKNKNNETTRNKNQNEGIARTTTQSPAKFGLRRQSPLPQIQIPTYNVAGRPYKQPSFQTYNHGDITGIGRGIQAYNEMERQRQKYRVGQAVYSRVTKRPHVVLNNRKCLSDSERNDDVINGTGRRDVIAENRLTGYASRQPLACAVPRAIEGGVTRGTQRLSVGLSRNQLQTIKVLGGCCYGDVFIALATHTAESSDTTRRSGLTGVSLFRAGGGSFTNVLDNNGRGRLCRSDGSGSVMEGIDRSSPIRLGSVCRSPSVEGEKSLLPGGETVMRSPGVVTSKSPEDLIERSSGGGRSRVTKVESVVLVKSLLSHTEEHVAVFRREIELLTRVNHEHVIRLVGLCREAEPIFLITEYCVLGDLKHYLQSTHGDVTTAHTSTTGNHDNVTRPPPSTTPPSSTSAIRSTACLPLTFRQKVTMCGQVALAMEHIASAGLAHRDLAARNVLVNPSLDIKVSFTSLSVQSWYHAEYCPVHSTLVPVPLRWMAPEAVLQDVFNMETDVWAYGIFVWEVSTNAALPYGQQSNEEVLNMIRQWKELHETQREQVKVGNKYLTYPPEGCTQELWAIINKCVEYEPENRISFTEIIAQLHDITNNEDNLLEDNTNR